MKTPTKSNEAEGEAPQASAVSLGQMFEEIPKHATRRETIDISHLIGLPLGSRVLTFQEPDIPALHQRFIDARLLKKEYPTWPDSLLMTVALMALCHASPMPKPGEPPIGKIYAGFALNQPMWSYLEPTFFSRFPELRPWTPETEQEAIEAKND